MGKYNKNPKMVFQKGENCQVAMDFIKLEGIHLTNIGASAQLARSVLMPQAAPPDARALTGTVTGNQDVAEGNVKLTAALLFALMEHYHFGLGARLPVNMRLWLCVRVRAE